MTDVDRIPRALLVLRLAIFLFLLVWVIDKFQNPEHAASVFEAFYYLRGIGEAVIYVVGAAQLLLIIGFVLGFRKRLTYGLVLLLHAVSTLSSFRQYFAPYDGANILFFAAWPTLAACFALYYLRDLDTLWTVSKAREGLAGRPVI